MMMMSYTIYRTTVKPSECNVTDVTYLGYDATRIDLHRWWSAFITIYHDRWLIEDLGIQIENFDSAGEAIDNWLWSNGEWSDRLDQILGEAENA